MIAHGSRAKSRHATYASAYDSSATAKIFQKGKLTRIWITDTTFVTRKKRFFFNVSGRQDMEELLYAP